MWSEAGTPDARVVYTSNNSNSYCSTIQEHEAGTILGPSRDSRVSTCRVLLVVVRRFFVVIRFYPVVALLCAESHDVVPQ